MLKKLIALLEQKVAQLEDNANGLFDEQLDCNSTIQWVLRKEIAELTEANANGCDEMFNIDDYVIGTYAEGKAKQEISKLAESLT